MGIVKNIGKINVLTKSADSIRYGIDYLRFVFYKKIPYLDNILNHLDYDNSNFHFDAENDFMFQKVKLSMGPALMVSVVYNDTPVPFMLYNLFDSENLKSRSRIDFYGSYFRLEELGFFPLGFYKDFISEVTTEIPSISRIDYAVDLFYDHIENMPTCKSVLGAEVFNMRPESKFFQIGKGDTIESRQLGQTNTKRIVVRMYNKLVDLSVKGKFFLYTDYMKWKSVHRFETQFGPSFCKGYSLEYLDMLIDKIAKIYKIYTGEPGRIFYKYTTEHDVTDYSKIFYTKIFCGKAKKFFDSGINPFLVLVDYFDENARGPAKLKQYQVYLQETYIRLKNHNLIIEALK